MATHSSTLAWKIPWMEGPGRLQSLGSQRVGHYWSTSLLPSYCWVLRVPFIFWMMVLYQDMSEKAMAPHSSTLDWKIPWAEEPGGLQSMGLRRVGTTEGLHFHFSLSWIGEGNGNPVQCSCLENPRDGVAWWAAVYGFSQSRTQLKWLSSSSSWTYVFCKCFLIVCGLSFHAVDVDFHKQKFLILIKCSLSIISFI